MGKRQKNINIQESQEVRLLPAGDHMAARNRQGNMTNTHETKTKKNDTQKKHRLGTVSKKIWGLNLFDVTNLTLISDVDQDK